MGIKFRTWCPIDKKLCYNMMVHDGSIGDYQVELNEGIKRYIKEEEYGLDQYIGLEDINGREAYAGDIIRLFYANFSAADAPDIEFRFKYHEIIFEDGLFGIFDGRLRLVKNNIVEYIHSFNDLRRLNFKFEIMGNKYENPELKKDCVQRLEEEVDEKDSSNKT